MLNKSFTNPEPRTERIVQMSFEPVIGLEVHAQLKTASKIFCGCSTEFGAPPNTHTCPVCLGLPGVLPVLNQKVVEYALRMALATDCTISGTSRFARKNYFYPDLPKGYQISQYELPLALDGHVDIDVDGRIKRIGLTRIHMEEDAGKLVHSDSRPVSLVDLNRAGTPLIEIVSEPDIRSAEEAGAYLRALRALIRWIGVGDGNMEEGSFRCDANVSIRSLGSTTLGTRTEIKNLNSFKHVEKAIAFEIARQSDILLEGGTVVQQTRLWDPDKGVTHAMRSKEEAHDYRYFPEPDLLPLVIDPQWVDRIRNELPELPAQRRARFVDTLGLPDYDAGVLTSGREIADYFEACLAAFDQPKIVGNWIMGALLGLLNAENKSIEQSPISPAGLAELLQLIDSDQISGKIAKTVFDEMAATGRSAGQIVAQKGLSQVSDSAALEAAIDKIITASPDEVARYKAGNRKLMGFFVGQVMKATQGKANPKLVNEILGRKLEN
jgi:aspartyl-tRNA(Asn)/glutamyl-tRNA(Gln) amidotransferase subunit B